MSGMARKAASPAAAMQDITPPAEMSADNGPDQRAAVQTWTGKAIAEHVHSKALDLAYRQWLFHRASRHPRLRDMYAEANMFDQTLLSMKTGDDYLVVAQSDAHIAQLGHDLRGSLSSERKFATANSLREIFDECIARNQPIYARYISSLSNRNTYWETMILPLTADGTGRPTFTLAYMSALNEKVDMLRILYDRSPVGIIAAVPIMDGRNKTDDARILTMNAKARELLSFPENKGQPHTVGELIRYVSATLQWSATGTTSQDQGTTILYQDTAGARVALTIELINHFILITVAPAAAAAEAEKGPAWNRFARLVGLTRPD